VVSVGARIEVEVHVLSPDAVSISAPISDHDNVLHRAIASHSGSRTSSAELVAVAPGQAEISALDQGDPCAPGAVCAPDAIGFYVTVVR
jgi:hypothetical protein